MVGILKSEMARQHCVLDAWVASDTVINGARPSPHMIYKNIDLLGIDFSGETPNQKFMDTVSAKKKVAIPIAIEDVKCIRSCYHTQYG